MRAELRSLVTIDHDELREFIPESPTEFGLYVRAMVGPVDGLGEESFDILVCSPSWLDTQPFEKGFRWGHGVLLMRPWDFDVLERAIEDLVNHTEGDSWTEIGERLGRFSFWEFDAYRE